MSTVVQGILLAVIGVLIFGLIIFIHEFGHFFTAKLSHVWHGAKAFLVHPR